MSRDPSKQMRDDCKGAFPKLPFIIINYKNILQIAM